MKHVLAHECKSMPNVRLVPSFLPGYYPGRAPLEEKEPANAVSRLHRATGVPNNRSADLSVYYGMLCL